MFPASMPWLMTVDYLVLEHDQAGGVQIVSFLASESQESCALGGPT